MTETHTTPPGEDVTQQSSGPWWRRKWFRSESQNESETVGGSRIYRSRATLGILSDKETDEVPGKNTIHPDMSSFITDKDANMHPSRDGAPSFVQPQ